MIVREGIDTLLKKTVLDAPEAMAAGGVIERGAFSTMWGNGVAVDGGSPKSAAEVGSGADLDGGRVGGLDDWREEEPEPPQSWPVVYGAADRRASCIIDRAFVTKD